MNKYYAVLFICVFLLFASVTLSKSTAQNGFALEYHLYMEAEDHPRVEIKVSGVQDEYIEFSFVSGGILGSFNDLTGIFTDISVSNAAGVIPWKWKDNKRIYIENSGQQDFTVRYNIDATRIARNNNSGDINIKHSGERFVLFSKKAVFFSPAEILIMPVIEPDELTLVSHLPENIKLFSSVQSSDGTFKAEKDLWGSLVNDFSKTYFFGGEALFSQEFKGLSGNTYEYVLFDWRNERDFYNSWFPSYANAKVAAQKYIEVTEMFLKYYSDNIAALPAHNVLVTDSIPSGYGFPDVASRGNWYNFMQLWPENAMLYQIAHHTYHSYSFMGWASKLSVHFPDGYLHEGLPTYYEHFVPSILLGEDSSMGRLYGLLMLDKRGSVFNINENDYHKKYNKSSLKVYLLDEAIKKTTDGKKNINDFSRELYVLAEGLTSPQHIKENQIEAAFSKAAGSGSIDLYRQISDMTEFDIEDFSKLYEPFLKYCDKMSREYFWNNRLLFLCYMDICSAMGDHWPHYGLSEQNIFYMRGDGLKGFKKYLQELGKTKLGREDIINAMSIVTGKDHSGFFEYWSSMGIELDPETIPELSTWFPEKDVGYSTRFIPSMSVLTGDVPAKEASDEEPPAGAIINNGTPSEKALDEKTDIPDTRPVSENRPKLPISIILAAFGIISGLALLFFKKVNRKK